MITKQTKRQRELDERMRKETSASSAMVAIRPLTLSCIETVTVGASTAISIERHCAVTIRDRHEPRSWVLRSGLRYSSVPRQGVLPAQHEISVSANFRL
jgi:hypothetical protein